ncbi:MAG: glycosyltransferase [Calditrichaeota bacterium]|nr:MAG: glycosyltransferase [Calditrichota bacterium]
MRIAIWVPNVIVPMETFIITQIKQLCDAGHMVRIVAFGKLKGMAPYRDDRYPVFEHTLNVAPPTNDLKKARAMGRAFFASRHKTAVFKALNAKRFGRLTNKMYLSWYCLALEQQLDMPTDLVLCHFGHIGNIAAGLYKLGLLATPFATFFHGFDFHRLVPRYGAGFYNLLKESDRPVLAASAHLRDALLGIGFDPQRTFVHHMALDPLFFSPPPALDKHDHPRSLALITVARLEKIKGLHLAIQAMRLLRSDGIPFHYTIIGDGSQRAILEEMVREMGLTDSIRFTGPLSGTAIRQHLDAAHLFILPSIIDEGGAPLVLQEAMSRGVLVVGSQRGGIPALIAPHGWLLESETPDAIHQAIRAYWMTTPAERRHRQAEAIKRIQTEFDIAALNKRLLEICGRFLS